MESNLSSTRLALCLNLGFLCLWLVIKNIKSKNKSLHIEDSLHIDDSLHSFDYLSYCKLIGNTPLVELSKISNILGCKFLVKVKLNFK